MPSLKDKTVLDRVVSPASARARGGYADLNPSLACASFGTNSFLTGQTLHIDGGGPLT
jgi:hypothetical protein